MRVLCLILARAVLRPSTTRILCALIVLTGGRSSGEAVPFDFSDYLFPPFGWQKLPDGLQSSGPATGDAKLIAAPISRSVSMEAEVVVEKGISPEWKVAAVAIIRDAKNYWHFGLVEAPDGVRQNFCELSEMRDGTWNAQGSLKLILHETPGGQWKHGERYRLRIALTPESVEGSVHDAAGKLVERKKFALRDSPAVNTGRPGLRSPGFEARFTNIRAEWTDAVPEQELRTSFPPYKSNSFVPNLRSRATGFFRVEQQAGKWWAIDPLGRGFVPLGIDHVRYTGHWCESLGYAPYHRTMQKLYPNRDDWVAETARRMTSWGFNRLGGHASEPMLHQGLNYSRFVGVGTPMAKLGDDCDITPNEDRPCSAFPNVFHPQFEAYCRYQAEAACRPCLGDPWLFGYFLDNELAWWGRGDHETGLFEAVMKKPATHTAKIALRNFLAERHDHSIAALNKSWKANVASFDAILGLDHIDGANPGAARADKRAFLALVADRYFSCTTKAVRAIDPDHLILGCRFAGGWATEEVWAAAAKYCDVLTLNYYGNVDLDRGLALDDNHTCQGEPLEAPFAKFAGLAGNKPLMVTEWSFIGLDSGLPCTNGAGQRFQTQAERARAAGIFAETLLRIPEVIGFDYFMWADEPAAGISTAFPENSNYGLVNEQNEIYPEMVEALSGVLHQAGRLHREGPRPRTQAAPEIPPALSPKEFLALQRGKQDDTSLAFERQGNAFTIRNGQLVLEGAVGSGPMLHSMRLGDLELGRFHATVHQWAGRNEWPRADSVTGIEARREGTALVVDVSCQFDKPAGRSLLRPFEVTYRIHLLPQSDWFLLELLSYRNLADQPAHLRAIYFHLFSNLGGNPATDRPASGERVPRLWGRLPGDAWIDQATDAYIGLVAPRHTPVEGNFWLNEHGGQHPDVRWVAERILQAGESLTPDQPIYVIVTAGQGGRKGWESTAKMPGLKQE